jgi:hypothetical protein
VHHVLMTTRSMILRVHVSGMRWGSGHVTRSPTGTLKLSFPAPSRFQLPRTSCAKLAADPTVRPCRVVALVNHNQFGPATIDTTSPPPASPHDGAVTESSAPPAIVAFHSGSLAALWRITCDGERHDSTPSTQRARCTRLTAWRFGL